MWHRGALEQESERPALLHNRATLLQRRHRHAEALAAHEGHNQITDLYLLALAVRYAGCLLSFDQGIALSSVHGAAPKNLMLL